MSLEDRKKKFRNPNPISSSFYDLFAFILEFYLILKYIKLANYFHIRRDKKDDSQSYYHLIL